ncbi:MAG TPA: methyltransferase domain-containing protein [Jatrophihabitans sp.]|nr:methyltransferase domain-containing protein [Jatrophihabitans sp.]
MTRLSAYTTGVSRQNIDQALRAAGKDPAAPDPADLAPLEEFHTLGRLATAQLAELAGISRSDRVLDAGTGIGGTARFLAARYGCPVLGVDLTPEYCETARWLTEVTGMSDRVVIEPGDVTDLPFTDGAFDVVFSQHVQMNIADKAALYAEAYRVLAPGGRLAMWDVTGAADRVVYPVPWAPEAADSHLVTADDLRAAVESAGFVVEHWNDLTAPTLEIMTAVLAQPANPLGLHVFVPDFATKVANLVRGLDEGWLRVVRGLAVRPAA